eukprot:gene21487-28463_t
MYDMREFEEHPGNSYLFRNGTSTLTQSGAHHQPLVMYATADEPITMLMTETGGAKALDFSSDGHLIVSGGAKALDFSSDGHLIVSDGHLIVSDGHLIVSGNLRGELSIWDVENHQHIKTWMAHKRSSITCVRFSHDSRTVYSCGEDNKVIVWDWRKSAQLSLLTGHTSAVVSVERAQDGSAMVSGDRDGHLIIWDTESNTPLQVLKPHKGPVLGVTISPDGKSIASAGADEHIAIIDTSTGEEIMSLDDALEGRGMTIKFSFDGTRDSRQLLSVGADGKVRLWDSAAGSEICQANFEVGFGDVETGGFIRCDISSNGSTMAGCTAKGHLIQWDVHKELRRGPNGSTFLRSVLMINL